MLRAADCTQARGPNSSASFLVSTLQFQLQVTLTDQVIKRDSYHYLKSPEVGSASGVAGSRGFRGIGLSSHYPSAMLSPVLALLSHGLILTVAW